MNDISQPVHPAAGAGWSARGGMAKALIAVSLALGSGLGTFAIAHAATASPSASPTRSTSPRATTHTCPNM